MMDVVRRVGMISVAVGGALVGTAACTRPATLDEITPWLLCDECVDGELDSVVALGARAVRALGRALIGPPTDRGDNMRRQFITRWNRIAAYLADRGRQPAMTQTDYVTLNFENYEASYQQRSAIALGRIGGPRAIRLLEGAVRNARAGRLAYRPDVVTVIQRALADARTR